MKREFKEKVVFNLIRISLVLFTLLALERAFKEGYRMGIAEKHNKTLKVIK